MPFARRSTRSLSRKTIKKNGTEINTANIINPILPRTRSKGVTYAFNKNVTFVLGVDTDKPPVPRFPLLNRYENPGAKVVDIYWTTAAISHTMTRR